MVSSTVVGLRRAVVWDCCHRTLAIQFLSQERGTLDSARKWVARRRLWPDVQYLIMDARRIQ